jgi:tetratricopeptide (TPR) repeat protein
MHRNLQGPRVPQAPGLVRIAALLFALVLLGAQLGGSGLAQTDPGAAAQAQRLDELFATLKSTKDEQEGETAIAEIWKVWLQSGRPELDEPMEQASRLMGAGLASLALPVLDDLVKRAPGWAEAWNKRATALYLAGEHDGSLADIERVLALEPRHFGALAGLGLIHIARGQHREALAAYRRALAVNPFLKERHELIPALERKVGDKGI